MGHYTTAGGTLNASLINGLDGPFGLTVADGFLYVANLFPGIVGKYNLDGTPVNASLINMGPLASPVGLAVLGTDLYVADQTTGKIGHYDTSLRHAGDNVFAIFGAGHQTIERA